MQKTTPGATSGSAIRYHERLTPSLWVIVSAAVVAPMAMMVFVPFDKTLAMAVGVLVAVGVVALLIGTAPRIEVRGGVLYAGRAHIGVDLLGEAQAYAGPQARFLRGPGLERAAWHLIRGGIDGVARVAVTDPDDPAPVWVISSRTPDRLVVAIRRAQRATADHS
ncbi:hypothetical protein GCM10022240_25360 [Microbacterium kribbense]|uniref:DUF3093 domain-containing protein n=1 Tax=Microbacterium kribbense TaxID=433645 RepID=A0ABP7GR24_9MICO